MRPIKFRIWHHKDGYMIESDASVATIIQKYLKGWGLGMQNGNYELDGTEYSIMQYTGLKDKNGVNIYEGDIVERDDLRKPQEIIFHSGTFKERDTDTISSTSWNIIGNIHRNPELL